MDFYFSKIISKIILYDFTHDIFVGIKEERNKTERTNHKRSRRFNSLNLRYTLNRVMLKDYRGNDLGSRVGSVQQLLKDRFFGARSSYSMYVYAREIYSQIKIAFGVFIRRRIHRNSNLNNYRSLSLSLCFFSFCYLLINIC